jgi:hypothetical protein
VGVSLKPYTPRSTADPDPGTVGVDLHGVPGWLQDLAHVELHPKLPLDKLLYRAVVPQMFSVGQQVWLPPRSNEAGRVATLAISDTSLAFFNQGWRFASRVMMSPP